MDGCRIDRGSDIHVAQINRPGGQLDAAHVADERDIGVIDRDRKLRLVILGRSLGGLGGELTTSSAPMSGWVASRASPSISSVTARLESPSRSAP